MSDATKLRPEDLTATVREMYPPPPPLAGWLGFYYDSGFYDSEQGKRADAGWYCSGKVHADREEALCELAGFRPFEGSAIVEVNRAVFAPAPEKAAKVETVAVPIFGDPNLGYELQEQPAPPEPAKVECPNSFHVGNCPTCGGLVSPWNKHAKYEGGYTCQPAPPEPAAPEMPGRKGWSDDPSWIVDCAATELRRLAALSREGIRNTSEDWPETCASRLENLWRNLAQPVAVGMTEELEVVLRLAAQYVEGWRQTYQSPEYREQMLTAIAAVRQQAAQGRKVEFPKGRELVSMVRSLTPYLSQLGCTDLARSFNDYADASATELDAAEGKSEGRG